MQLAAARDAVKCGWPGAQRKMDAAKQAEIDAARELEEAIAAEEKVIGKEYPEAIAKQTHVKAELAKERQHLAETEAASRPGFPPAPAARRHQQVAAGQDRHSTAG